MRQATPHYGRHKSCMVLILRHGRQDSKSRVGDFGRGTNLLGAIEPIAKSREARGEGAAILLRYAQGEGIIDIHRALNFSRVTIYKCIDKAGARGVDAARPISPF